MPTHRSILKGSTSQMIEVMVYDSTTGAGKTGKVYSDFACYYVRAGASAAVAVTLATATLGTYTSGGLKEMDATHAAGVYQFGIPATAIATGAGDQVAFYFVCSGCIIPPQIVPIVAYNPQDAVRMGMTALPNAASGSAGAIITSGTGANQIQLNGSGAVVAVFGIQGDVGGKVIGGGGGTITGVGAYVQDENGAAVAQQATSTSIEGIAGAIQAVTDQFVFTVAGAVDATTLNKTGYSLSSSQTFNMTGNITGNLSGSVGSVTGSVGSVTGAVGSVTGNVSGNITGSIGSLAAQAQTDVKSAMTSQGYSTARATLMDHLDADVSSRMATFSYTTPPTAVAIRTEIDSNSTQLSAIKTDTGNLITRIPSALFSGITSLAKWLGALAGKTADTATRTEINSTTAGAGFNETTDSQEAIRDRGDAAWTTGTGGGGGTVGSGADSCTLNFTNSATSAAIADADVWLTSDSAGTTVVAGTLQTDSFGDVTFMLDAGVTYYVWMQKDGVNALRGRPYVAVAD